MIILKELRGKAKMSQLKLAEMIGVSRSTVAMWETSGTQPDNEMLVTLSKIFGVTTYYLLGAEIKPEKPTINAKDEKDIAKDLDSIMEKLTNKEDGPASFNGEDMSEETTELFKDELERALRILKVINKEKYNPNKNKSR